MAEWKKVIVSGSTAELSGITLSGAVNAGTDTDKFLVLDAAGNVDYRTGAQVLSDIGAGTGGGDITRVNITAGDGLSGTVDTTTGEHTQTLKVGAGDGISVAADTVAVDATVLRTTGDSVVSGSSQITLGGDVSGTADQATVEAVQGVSLTSGEATQIANIGATTISSTQWGYLGVMNQNVRTTDAVTFATASISQNLTVGGDLIVQGDLTYLNTKNTLVEDQFILLGSGSAEASDIGIIFDGVGGATGTGAAFFYDGGVDRLSYATSVAHNATAVTPQAYIPLVFDVDGATHSTVAAAGNIKIEGGDAFIYV